MLHDTDDNLRHESIVLFQLPTFKTHALKSQRNTFKVINKQIQIFNWNERVFSIKWFD